LVPESTVDIALTVDAARPELGGTGAAGTKTIVRGVKVLATSETRYKSEERLGRPTRNITVAVTPHQANKLVLAQQYGQLSVTLRSELDADTTAVAWSDDQDLISPQELLGIRPVEVARPVKPKEFHIWRGGQKAVVTFTPEEYSEAQAATIAIGRNDGPIPASFEEVSSHGDGT